MKSRKILDLNKIIEETLKLCKLFKPDNKKLK